MQKTPVLQKDESLIISRYHLMFINSSRCLPLRVRPQGLYSSTLTDAGTVAAYYLRISQNLVRSSKMYSHKASHALLISQPLSVCFPLCYFFLSLLFLIKSLEYEIEISICTVGDICQDIFLFCSPSIFLFCSPSVWLQDFLQQRTPSPAPTYLFCL